MLDGEHPCQWLCFLLRRLAKPSPRPLEAAPGLEAAAVGASSPSSVTMENSLNRETSHQRSPGRGHLPLLGRSDTCRGAGCLLAGALSGEHRRGGSGEALLSFPPAASLSRAVSVP